MDENVSKISVQTLKQFDGHSGAKIPSYMEELVEFLRACEEGQVVEMMDVEDMVEVLLAEEESSSCYLLLSYHQ